MADVLIDLLAQLWINLLDQGLKPALLCQQLLVVAVLLLRL